MLGKRLRLATAVNDQQALALQQLKETNDQQDAVIQSIIEGGGGGGSVDLSNYLTKADFNTYKTANDGINTTQNSSLQSLQTNVANVTDDVNDLDTTVQTHTSKIDVIEIAISNANPSPNSINGRLGIIEAAVPLIQSAVNTNKADIATHTGQINGLTGGLNTANSNVAALAQRVSDAEADIQAHTDLLEDHAEAINAHDTRITELEGIDPVDLGPLTTRVTNLETEVTTPATGLKTKVTTIELTLNTPGTGLMPKVATIEADLNTPTTGLKARVSALEGGAAGDLTQLTNRVTVVEGDLNTATTGLKARMNAVQSAIGDESTALTGRVASLEVDRFKARTSLLQVNSDIDMGTNRITVPDPLNATHCLTLNFLRSLIWTVSFRLTASNGFFNGDTNDRVGINVTTTRPGGTNFIVTSNQAPSYKSGAAPSFEGMIYFQYNPAIHNFRNSYNIVQYRQRLDGNQNNQPRSWSSNNFSGNIGFVVQNSNQWLQISIGQNQMETTADVAVDLIVFNIQ